MVRFVPFFRNIRRNLPDCVNIDLLRPGQCWLERIPSRNVSVNAVPGIDATQRRIREAPIAGVETIALVDKSREIPS